MDDAIVVVEAVKNHISNGEKPLQATIAAMKEVSGPIVSTALVISCVFIPTLLLPGVTGKLFEQFAVTIGMSIIISAFCALSLSPTLSAGLLRGGKRTPFPAGALFQIVQQGFQQGARLVRGNLRQAYPAHVAVHPAAGRHDRPPLSPGQTHSQRIPSQ